MNFDIGNKKRCVLFCNSPIFWCDKLDNSDFIIACDGGYKYAKQYKIKPDLVVGDFDSYKNPLDKKVPVFKAPVEKDDTDTMLAIKIAIENGLNDFLLLGVTGGRIDHQIAAFQALAYIAREGCSCVAKDEYNSIYAICNSKISIDRVDNAAISVFSFSDKCVGVTYTGLNYALTNATLSSTNPIGVSNEFKNSTATIEVKNGVLLIIVSSRANE